MDLLLLGTSHRTASVATRERLAASVGEVSDWLRAAVQSGEPVSEVFVVATCHRLEVYAAVSDLRVAEQELRGLIRGGADVGDSSELASSHYVLTGSDVITHLCRVACGLDSIIVGEAEIAGQIRRAATTAREAGTMGPYLEAAVAGALGASGRAREETRIGRGVLSAASASVALAESIRGSLVDQAVLVIGAGQTGRQALARAARGPHGRLLIASRSERHAREAAAATGAQVLTLADVPAALVDVDVVIAAVQAPETILTLDHCRHAMAARPDRPLLAIDLSVPRVIAGDVALVPNVQVRSVDDLGDVVRQSAARRAKEIPLVESIIQDETCRAYSRVEARRKRVAGAGC
jgi:glutamyl-tRNA reductase